MVSSKIKVPSELEATSSSFHLGVNLIIRILFIVAQNHVKEKCHSNHTYCLECNTPNLIASSSTGKLISFKALNLMQYPVTLALPIFLS